MHSRGIAVIVSSLLLLAGTAAAQSSAGSEAAALQGFGAVVAVQGQEVIVGEPNNMFRAGMVYVFRPSDSGAWLESQVLTAPEASRRDRFGRSLALAGRDMLVGAQRSGDTGVVHLFDRGNDGDWRYHSTLAGADASFGSALALREDLALIGVPVGGDSAGQVMVYHREQSGDWAAVATLAAESGEVGDRFGAALALDGDHLLVGAPGRNEDQGVVYHFHWDGRAWVEQGMLTPGRIKDAGFGSAIVASDNTAYVGMPRSDDRLGGVIGYRFDAEAGWQQSTTLAPFDGGRSAGFGTALALTADGLLVGVPGQSTIHSFSWGDGGIQRVSKILPEDRDNARSFGGSLAVAAATAVVGVSGGDHGAGNAVILTRDRKVWTQAAMVSSPPEGLASVTGGRVDCHEGTARYWDCDGVDMISFLSVADVGGGRGVWLNDLWGWTDPDTGREYALIGRLDGTSFVDLTDPVNPRYLGDLPKTDGSLSAVWRDIKVYRNHAYIVADGAGQHGMQVFDLTELREVTEPRTFAAVALYDNIASAHNVVINEATGFAYVVGASGGGTTCGGGLHIVDIRQPAEPSFIGCVADVETGRRQTGYSHDAQCVIYHGPDENYRGREICIGSNETALSFADVTDKDNPILISNVSYPNVAYAHQGWLSDDHRFFFTNDELDEPRGLVQKTRTLVWDVAELDDPVLLVEYFGPTADTDHNLYVRGNLMYQSNTGAGLRIIDISDPDNLVEVGYFDTSPESLGCCSTWSNYPYFASGVIPVTGGNAGVFFLMKRENPVP